LLQIFNDYFLIFATLKARKSGITELNWQHGFVSNEPTIRQAKRAHCSLADAYVNVVT